LGIKKEKPKSKCSPTKPAKKPSHKSKKTVDLVEVRKDITNIVGNEAADMAQAVVDEALKGQLAPVRYLFEVAGLYPVAGEAAEARPEEDSLARTLLRRLGLPEDPVIVREDESTILALPAPRTTESEGSTSPAQKDEEKADDSQSDSERKENHEESASTGTNPVK
jgi:hypothetical protein